MSRSCVHGCGCVRLWDKFNNQLQHRSASVWGSERAKQQELWITLMQSPTSQRSPAGPGQVLHGYFACCSLLLGVYFYFGSFWANCTNMVCTIMQGPIYPHVPSPLSNA
eukprot:XP_001695372.1 predicted protein [Chlamydomonas reinhardtii]